MEVIQKLCKDFLFPISKYPLKYLYTIIANEILLEKSSLLFNLKIMQ